MSGKRKSTRRIPNICIDQKAVEVTLALSRPFPCLCRLYPDLQFREPVSPTRALDSIAAPMRILLVEDDLTVSNALLEVLRRASYSVDHLASAEPAESLVSRIHYDLAIVDIGLPGMDGYELIRRWRRRKSTMPIMILTARDGLRDRVMGLDLGADDYMLKPFQVPELLARIRALIRRCGSATSSELLAGKIRIDLSRRVAEVDGQTLDLTSREWEILQQLVLASPKPLSKQKMVESLSQWDNELTSNAVEIYVSRLRTKLRNCGIEIHTIRGLGYRLDETLSS